MKDEATHLMHSAITARGIARYLTGALALSLVLTTMPTTAATSPPALNAEAISAAAHSKASVTDDGVVKIGWARTDVVVNVDGAPLPPSAGLGSWAAFTPLAQGAMVMGDTVVFQDEADAAMDAAFANGLDVTGLHNHFFYDEPHVYFMHIEGMGDAVKLAGAVNAMWEAIRAVRKAHPQPQAGFFGAARIAGKLDAEALAKQTGLKPQVIDAGIVKFVLGRDAKMHGVAVGGSMGLSTWAAFVGSDAAATVDGDFLMTAKEVQPVLRALRAGGLHIVALHSHMVGEQPTAYFTHYWGKGTAASLATAIRAALDAQRRVE